MSNRFLPLANVTFSPLNASHITSTISDVGGYFDLSGFCDDDIYVLRKQGYVDTEIRFTGGTLNITMIIVGEKN